ncbi:hypothetical protein TOPH_00194 [Tolypocladium ophioglossoides CBS 100239]|uniref:Uncharacterized protein n=1 Tax=Tolypocladium ophioglossoides (strain CBS 100239) TaxID=1163406 RepID=A0A0L0NLR6_TOLOC|nr:hypothetical protein TOPH_00194 [Tolypocladium ophioglossoides CBS 100239]
MIDDQEPSIMVTLVAHTLKDNHHETDIGLELNTSASTFAHRSLSRPNPPPGTARSGSALALCHLIAD